MKLTGRQSTNVQDKTKDAGASFPHSSGISNPMARALRTSEYNAGKATVQRTMSNPNNPFGKMLSGMDKAAKADRRQNIQNRQNGVMAKVPIPQPRPDPKSKTPKTFGKG